MSVAMDQLQQQHSRPQQRPRTQSTLSFKSNKSHTSDGAKHARKPSGDEKLHTKADPNQAMNESQPIAAALEKPTLQSLREFQHTDTQGQPIVEPDLSNPTRSRWERPLDTIRSFEAAIDNEYRRRSHTVRGGDTNTEVSGFASRRSSYYGGPENRHSQVNGFYGNRPGARDSWADNAQGMGGPVGGPPRTRYSRQQSDPQWNRYGGGGNAYGHPVYPTQGYQQSRDTVNTNGSNGSHSEPYSNDPSENSSFERAAPVMRPDMGGNGDAYAMQGIGGPIMEENGYANNAYFVQQPQQQNGYPRNSNGYGGPPPVPVKGAGPPPPPAHNAPIKLSKTNSNGPVPSADTQPRPNALTRQGTDKRRSWFKRRFSKE